MKNIRQFYHIVLKHILSKKSDFGSLDFIVVVSSFKANSMDTVKQCQQFFNFEFPCLRITIMAAKFGS